MSTTYTIVKPKKIVKSQIELSEIPSKSYLVKVKYTQICDADAKYYYGLRPKFPYSIFGFKYFFGIRDREALKKKYPLIPIHEAIGIIDKVGPNASLKENTRIVLIPSISCNANDCEFCSNGNENYCKDSKFMSSNAPGFARNYLIQDEKAVAKIPNEVPDEVAVFTEMSTVAYNALDIANIKENDKVTVFGDGYLAYVLSILLSSLFNVKKENLFVFGKHDEKLSNFSDFSTTINTSKLVDYKQFHDKMDKAFECVGKRNAEEIIDRIIDILRPTAHLILLGVSEEKVPVNTRNILSKNITIKGVSRSSAKYFPMVLEKMKDKKLQNLYKRIPFQRIKIGSAGDIKKAFEEYMINRKKLVMEWF